jgi:hypothetical protein
VAKAIQTTDPEPPPVGESAGRIDESELEQAQRDPRVADLLVEADAYLSDLERSGRSS